MGVEAGCKGANISSHEDNHENICDLCKQDGKSLICYGKGCRRCYHLSCLGPPLDGVPSGVWHCLWCVKKKIEYGVHSVSKGIELICDAREVEVLGPTGTQRQKQYLVKYQGLAHVHNDWLPEEPLLIEVPSIIADFNQKNHGVSWNSEWTIPQCLLKKRLLSFSKLHGKNKNLDVDNDLECKHEWLVKWNGLDIENATWELENADFLCSSLGLRLIKEYESCQGKPSEMLLKHNAYQNGLESSKFHEYWLPVQVSNLQLEQYCHALYSNINALCSSSKKNDLVGVLNDVLLNVRKCCDHPYSFDGSVLTLTLNKGLSPEEIFEFGIKASGKLLLLDKMLSEIKHRHLNVVIYFQDSIGTGSSLVSILEHFLQGRFGVDSYECVHSCLHLSKRQAALNRFMKKENGLFVLLLEHRMCNSSIRLSSVDNVIIYGSDSNPQNDLKLIQKLSFMPQSKPIRVFRLYSCYTVEEQALVIAKQDPVDNIQSLHRNTKSTLMWGASHLFSRLDEYHASDCQASDSDISYGESFLNDVVKEFCSIISPDNEMDAMHIPIISKVLQSSGPCTTKPPLFGEQSVKYTCGEEPQLFWKGLLEGKSPRWRHISGPTPRNRKRVKYFHDSPCTPDVSNDEAGKKRRKVVNSDVDVFSNLPVPEGGQLADSKKGPSTTGTANQSLPKSTPCQNGAHDQDHGTRSLCSPSHVDVGSVERKALRDDQKNLQVSLKAEIAKVIEVLKLSDDVKNMVGIFIDYIMENLRVCIESATLSQALQVSLCKMAARILGQKIDVNTILLLTKEHLEFECTKHESKDVYRRLRSKTEAFLRHLEKIGYDLKQPKRMENAGTEIIEEEICTNKNFVAQQTTDVRDNVVESEMDKMVRQVQCKCDMRMSRLKEKQHEEIEHFQIECERKRISIEKLHSVQLVINHAIHCNTIMGKNKLKQLNDNFAREIAELNRFKDMKIKEIEENHETERNMEMQKAASWIANAKLCCVDGVATELHSCTSDSRDDVGDPKADDHNSYSRDDTRRLQDSLSVNGTVFHSGEGAGNLQDVAGARKTSDSCDDVANLQDTIHANKDATGCGIDDLEDNISIDSVNHPLNIPPRDDIKIIPDNANVVNIHANKDATACGIGNLEDNTSINSINHPSNVSPRDDIRTAPDNSNVDSLHANKDATACGIGNLEDYTSINSINCLSNVSPIDDIQNIPDNAKVDSLHANDDATVCIIGNLEDNTSINGINHPSNVSPGDDIRNIPDNANVDSLHANKDATACGIGNLEDNTAINSINHPSNVPQGDDIQNISDYANVDNPPSVSSPFRCNAEANGPSESLNESEHNMEPPNVHTSTSIVSQSKEVFTTTVSEKPTEAISTTEVFLSSPSQPNELFTVGYSCEDTVPVVPSSFENSVDEIPENVHSEADIPDHMSEEGVPGVPLTSIKHTVSEISVGAPNENIICDKISEGVVHVVPLAFETQTVDNVVGDHPSEDIAPGVPMTFKKHTIDEVSVGAHSEDVIGGRQLTESAPVVQIPFLKHTEISVGSHSEGVICGRSSKEIAPVVSLTFEKHAADEISVRVHGEDGIIDHTREVHESRISTGGLLVKDCSPTNITDSANSDRNQNDAANNCADGNSPSQDNLLALPNVQTCAYSDDCLSQHQDHVPEDNSCQLLVLDESQLNREQQLEFEAGSLRGDDARPIAHSNCESAPTENSEPPQPQGGFSNISDQPPSEAACATSPNRETNDSHPSEPSPVLVDFPNVTLHQSQTGLAASRISCHSSSDLHCTLPQNTTTSLPLEVRISSELHNQLTMQPSYMASVPGPTNAHTNHPHFMSPINLPARLPVNPLSKELERINKEIEHAVKSHEDWKVRHRSDCEKEIQEMVAQICRRYESKFQETEAAFLKRKSELEGNHNKVLMHKILAEAYRSKCREPRSAVLPQSQQAKPPSYMLLQQQLQNASVLHALRPPPSVFLPASHQASNPPGFSLRTQLSVPSFSSQAVQPQQMVGHQHASSVPSPFSWAYNNNPSPNISRSISPSATATQPTLSSSVPARPPLIGDMLPSGGNTRISVGDMRARAPAPHLHLFRPVSIPSAATTTTAPLLPQVPPQLPQAVFFRLPQQLVVTENTETNNNTLPHLPEISTSAATTSAPLPQLPPQLPHAVPFRLPQQLVANDTTENNNILLPLPEFDAAFDMIDLSEFGIMDNTSAAQTNAPMDVVYLSDDD
ncbi:unnamed protein product [Cuscuta campestris]|uniref:Uncharacterized protein n=1 Tax=Cuscuta campestris TaxID=132261 RepID=A0A484LYM7_9ASTE|nr:unnamed protein product [Cuscuta campestris]